MSTTTDLTTLKINKLRSQAQYNKALDEGNVSASEFYLVPEPTLEGNNIAISTAEPGKITFSVADASTSAPGIVQLSDVVNEIADRAVTPKAVKDAIDDAIDALDFAEPEAILYSNNTPIVNGIGSIKPGQVFTDVTIQDMLTMILYPYIDIEIGTTATATPGIGSYDVRNLPTLQSVVLNVTKNSATNLSFELWDTTKDTKVAGPLTETNLSSNKLTFSDLNYAIDTTRTFAIKYSYKKDDGTRVPTSGTKSVTVGTFTITFTDPVIPTPTSNLAKTSWYAGQTADVTSITVSAPTLNSAEKITKLELYKDGSKVGDAVTNPTFPHTFSRTDNLTSTSTSTVNNTYKVRAYFQKRNGTSTTYSESYKDSSNLTITFTYVPATISLSGVNSNTSISKLNPQTISANTVKATFTKNSDKITAVKLYKNNSVIESKTISGHKGDAYSATSGNTTFSFAQSNICSNIALTAKAFNVNTQVGNTSSAINLNFYAPYCYGFVAENKSFNDIDATILKDLTSSKSKKTNITLAKPSTPKKFIYAVPNGTFTSAKDGAGEENFGLFEKNSSGSYTKTITFADGSTQTYQILILKNASAAAVNLTFS